MPSSSESKVKNDNIIIPDWKFDNYEKESLCRSPEKQYGRHRAEGKSWRNATGKFMSSDSFKRRKQWKLMYKASSTCFLFLFLFWMGKSITTPRIKFLGLRLFGEQQNFASRPSAFNKSFQKPFLNGELFKFNRTQIRLLIAPHETRKLHLDVDLNK